MLEGSLPWYHGPNRLYRSFTAEASEKHYFKRQLHRRQVVAVCWEPQIKQFSHSMRIEYLSVTSWKWNFWNYGICQDILKEQRPRDPLAKNEHFGVNCLWNRSPVMLRKLHTNPSKFFGVHRKKIILIVTRNLFPRIQGFPSRKKKISVVGLFDSVYLYFSRCTATSDLLQWTVEGN